MLAAWFRLKYPHIATGALASSAPILQFDDITPWSSFYDAVSQDYKVSELSEKKKGRHGPRQSVSTHVQCIYVGIHMIWHCAGWEHKLLRGDQRELGWADGSFRTKGRATWPQQNLQDLQVRLIELFLHWTLVLLCDAEELVHYYTKALQ